jgi:hypothetical protein
MGDFKVAAGVGKHSALSFHHHHIYVLLLPDEDFMSGIYQLLVAA